MQDPSGYLWEVLPASGEDEPVREMNILVSRLDESVKFYRDLLGMQVVRREAADGEEGYQRVHSRSPSQCLTPSQSLLHVDMRLQAALKAGTCRVVPELGAKELQGSPSLRCPVQLSPLQCITS